MVDAHHTADDLPGGLVLGQPVHRAALFARGAALRVDGHHAARLVQTVDGLPVRFALGTTHAETAETLLRRAVVGEPDTQGIGGVEEELLRCIGQHLMWRGDVQRDIALARLLVEQFGSELGGIGVGVADQNATPAAMQDHRAAGLLLTVLGEACLQPLVGRSLSAQQTLTVGLGLLHGAFLDAKSRTGSGGAMCSPPWRVATAAVRERVIGAVVAWRLHRPPSKALLAQP